MAALKNTKFDMHFGTDLAYADLFIKHAENTVELYSAYDNVSVSLLSAT